MSQSRQKSVHLNKKVDIAYLEWVSTSIIPNKNIVLEPVFIVGLVILSLYFID